MNNDQGGWAHPDGGHSSSGQSPRNEPPPGDAPPYGPPVGGAYGPPPGGAAPYGPPPNDPSYGPPPGAPPYGPPPGVAPYGPPNGRVPRSRSRYAGLIVGVCAVTVIALMNVRAYMERTSERNAAADKPSSAAPVPVPTSTPTSPAAEPHSLTIPKSFAGYVRASRDEVNEFRSGTLKGVKRESAETRRMLARAKYAVYRKHGTVLPALFFVGYSADADPELARDLRSTSPSEEADSFLLGGSITRSTAYPAGPLGGAFRCVRDKSIGKRATVCVWADESVIGWVMSPVTADPAVLARDTLSLRGAAER